MTIYNYSCYHFTKWMQFGQITYQECVAVAILNGLTILPAIILNALILVSIWRTPSLHLPAMVLLGNLALSDFAVGIIAQPVIIATSFLELRGNEYQEAYCESAIAYVSTSTQFGGVSLLSITAVTVDRFLAIYLHLRYRSIVTMKKTVILCVLIWFMSLSVALFWMAGFTFYSTATNSIMSLCMAIIVICYGYIYKTLRRHQVQVDVQNTCSVVATEASMTDTKDELRPTSIKKYRKSVISSLYIYFAFVMCYFPLFCALVYNEITKDNYLSPKFVKFGGTIVLANSALNPVIFCWRLKELRNAVRETLENVRELIGLTGSNVKALR